MIETKFKKTQLRELLNLCTREMHFAFEEEMYKQVDGVAMGSPLGPVLANIFMVHLETNLIPQMGDKLASWGRYVDDTFTFVKANCINDIVEKLNGFHRDIQFTYEVEKEGIINFLDVYAYAPGSWKIGT